MYRFNPDEELRELERQYAQTGAVEFLDRANAIRQRSGLPLLMRRSQVLELEWRELDSDAFQFLNQLWGTWLTRDTLMAICREVGYDEETSINEVEGLIEEWETLLEKRRAAFDRYLDHTIRVGRGEISDI